VLRGRIWLLVAGAGLAVLIWRLAAANPGALGGEDGALRLVYLVALLAVVAGPGLMWGRIGSQQLRFAAIWAAIILGGVAVYGLATGGGTPAQRISGAAAPARPLAVSDAGVELRRSDDGHFYALAEVNGQAVRFLVDTGASSVVLTADDARRIGVDPEALTYNRRHSTANGVAWGARIRLERIDIGPLTVRDIPASVLREGLDVSLLGEAFLRRLDGYDVRRDRLILHQG